MQSSPFADSEVMKRIYILLALLIGGLFAARAQDTAAITLSRKPNQSPTERDTLPQQNYFSPIAHQRWNQQDFDESIANFERSLAVSQQLNDTVNEATINRELGEFHIEQGDYEAAVGYLKKSLAMYQASSDTVRQGLTLLSLATALNHTKRYSEALQYLNNTLPVVQRGKDIQLVRLYYGLLAQTYQHLGQSEPAMEYFMYYMSIDSEIQERVSRKVQQQAVLAEEQVFKKSRSWPKRCWS